MILTCQLLHLIIVHTVAHSHRPLKTYTDQHTWYVDQKPSRTNIDLLQYAWGHKYSSKPSSYSCKYLGKVLDAVIFCSQRRFLTRTCYELDSRGLNPTGSEIFCTCLDHPWGPPSLLYNGYWLFPGGKAAGAWRWPPTLHLVPRLRKGYGYISTCTLGLRGLLKGVL